MSKQHLKLFSIIIVLTSVLFSGTALAEPTPDSTVLLIHSDMTTQTNVFTDSSSLAHPMTAVGNAIHTPGTNVLGQSAMYFDGAGDAITAPDDPAWDLADGDFTIDYWINPQQVTFLQGVVGPYLLNVYKGWLSGLHQGKPWFFCNLIGDGNWSIELSDPELVELNQWTHIAVVRKDNTFTLYRNGIAVSSATKSGAVSVTGGPLNIGTAAANYPLKGHLDEIRIVKSAVWDGPFTPPTTPYTFDSTDPSIPQDVKPSGDDRMIIKADGKVGIGTTSPQGELAVNGKIVAKEVVVTPSGWADHVFENGYDLRSMSEVRDYIRENGHLPGVPSETSLNQSGISVSEMMAIQMEKIEELTLYVLSLEEKIRVLEGK